MIRGVVRAFKLVSYLLPHKRSCSILHLIEAFSSLHWNIYLSLYKEMLKYLQMLLGPSSVEGELHSKSRGNRLNM